MKLWIGWVAVGLIASLALAGCSKGGDQSSAKGALDTMAKAFKTHDGAAITAYLPPDYRKSMGPMFVASMDRAAKAESLKKAITEKFGKDLAEKSIPAESLEAGNMFAGALSADGTIDWSKAKVTEDGDAATFEAGGQSKGLKKYDGKWCLEMAEGVTPEAAQKASDESVKMDNAFGKAYAGVEKEVKDGKIATPDDLDKAMSNIVIRATNEAMKAKTK